MQQVVKAVDEQCQQGSKENLVTLRSSIYPSIHTPGPWRSNSQAIYQFIYRNDTITEESLGRLREKYNAHRTGRLE